MGSLGIWLIIMTSVFILQIPFSSLSVKVMPQLTGFQQDWSRVKQIAKVILWHMHSDTHTYTPHSTMSNKPKNDNHSKVTYFACHAIGNFCHGNTSDMHKRKQKNFFHVKYTVLFVCINIISYSSRRAFFLSSHKSVFAASNMVDCFKRANVKQQQKQHQQKFNRELWIYISLIFRHFFASVVYTHAHSHSQSSHNFTILYGVRVVSMYFFFLFFHFVIALWCAVWHDTA